MCGTTSAHANQFCIWICFTRSVFLDAGLFWVGRGPVTTCPCLAAGTALPPARTRAHAHVYAGHGVARRGGACRAQVSGTRAGIIPIIREYSAR